MNFQGYPGVTPGYPHENYFIIQMIKNQFYENFFHFRSLLSVAEVDFFYFYHWKTCYFVATLVENDFFGIDILIAGYSRVPRGDLELPITGTPG